MDQATVWMGRVMAAAGFFETSGLAFAQGCSMCYSTAAAAKNAAIHALRSGILILLIPPVLITLGIFLLALRRQDRFADVGPSDSSVDRELNEWLARMSPGNANVSPPPKANSSI